MKGPRAIPQFDDYHRTVIGYHGTRRSTAMRVVQGLEPLTPSTNADDWLGSGVYFWEHAPQQAWWWADRRRQQGIKDGTWKEDEEIAVLASMIRLGHCFDLLDPENIQLLKMVYDDFVKAQGELKKPIPANANTHRYLDCAVFEYAYAWLRKQGGHVDTCRAVYVPIEKKKRV